MLRSDIQIWIDETAGQQEVIISDDGMISITATMTAGQSPFSGLLSLSAGLAVEEDEGKEGSNQ